MMMENQDKLALARYPQPFHNQLTSPQSLLKKRYKINEPITAATDIVYGFDQLSKMPKNLKVAIKVFHGLVNREEYQR